MILLLLFILRLIDGLFWYRLLAKFLFFLNGSVLLSTHAVTAHFLLQKQKTFLCLLDFTIGHIIADFIVYFLRGPWSWRKLLRSLLYFICRFSLPIVSILKTFSSFRRSLGFVQPILRCGIVDIFIYMNRWLPLLGFFIYSDWLFKNDEMNKIGFESNESKGNSWDINEWKEVLSIINLIFCTI